MKVVLSLPENVVEHIQSFSQATNRDISTVLADTVEMMWPAWETLLRRNDYPPVETLSDSEIIALACSKMDSSQNERLGQLQARGKAEKLTISEQVELLVLMRLYQLGQLRKSQGLAEAARRGLLTPISS